VRRLGLASDSSYRFERGVDPAGVDAASRRAAALIAEVAGGEVLEGALDADAGTLPGPRRVAMRLSRLRKVAGVDIPRRQAARLLAGLGFEVVETDETLEVTVPTRRHEVAREIDLVEEVLRTHGLDKVPLNESIPIRVARPVPRWVQVDAAKDLLVGAGYREIWSVAFVEDDAAAVDPPLFTDAPPLKVKNPVRPETPCLRRSLLAGLLRAKKLNQDQGTRAVKLFEVSAVYLPRPDDQPDERMHLGLLADPADRGMAFSALKGEVEALLDLFGLGRKARFRPAPRSSALDPTEAAEVLVAGERVGFLGKLGRAPAERFDLRERPYVALLDLEPVLAKGSLARRFEPLPQYPAVTRDLAAVLDRARPWEEVLAAVESAKAEHLAGVSLLSVYEGDPIPAGKKSVAFSLEFRAVDRTLTGEEADRGRERVKAALVRAFGASFRE
jgi:phenylalanyl-tRNA synthetase beta chain